MSQSNRSEKSAENYPTVIPMTFKHNHYHQGNDNNNDNDNDNDNDNRAIYTRKNKTRLT